MNSKKDYTLLYEKLFWKVCNMNMYMNGYIPEGTIGISQKDTYIKDKLYDEDTFDRNSYLLGYHDSLTVLQRYIAFIEEEDQNGETTSAL